MATTNAETRAARRRTTWTGGRAASFEELEEKGLEFWVNAAPGAKLQAMWDAIVEAWTINGKNGPPPDFRDLLSALATTNAEYLVVGGWAVGYHAERSSGSAPPQRSSISCAHWVPTSSSTSAQRPFGSTSCAAWTASRSPTRTGGARSRSGMASPSP